MPKKKKKGFVDTLPRPLRMFRARRRDRGMTQKELADAADVSRQTVCDFERGANRPYYSTLVKLCETLGVTMTLRKELMRHFWYESKDSDEDYPIQGVKVVGGAADWQPSSLPVED